MDETTYKGMSPEQTTALRTIVSGIKEDSTPEELQEAISELVELVEEIPEVAMMMTPEEEKVTETVEEEDAFKMGSESEDEDESAKSAIRGLRRALGLKSWHGKKQALAALKSMSSNLNKPAGVKFSAKGLAGVVSAYNQLRETPAPQAQPASSGQPANAHPQGKKSSQNLPTIYQHRDLQEYPISQMVSDLSGLDFGDIKARKTGQNYDVGTLGGYVVRQDIREDILPQLRESLVIEQAGATITQTPDDAVILLPKMSKSNKAQWVGINKQVSSSEAEFQQITLKPKPLAAISRIPIRMMNTMPAQAEQRIRNEIVKSLQLAIDYACFFGTGAVSGATSDFQLAGSGEEPLGLLNMAGVTQLELGSGDGGLASPDTLNTALTTIQAANVPLDKPAHITNSTLSGYFFSLTDTTGQPLNRIERQQRNVWVDGIPMLQTQLVPQDVTVGSSTDTGYIFTGNWNMMEVAIGQGIEIRVLTEKYADYLQIGILAFTYADMAVHYPEAFYVQSGVRNQ